MSRADPDRPSFGKGMRTVPRSMQASPRERTSSPDARFALAYERLRPEDEARSAWLNAHKNEGDE